MSIASRVRSGAIAALAGLALAAAGVAVTAAPASADDANPLEYSSDGVSWSTTPLASVFPAGFAFVPGDSLSSTIYLRNNRAVTSSIVVVISDLDVSDTELGQALTLSATDFASGGWASTPIADLRNCTAIMPRRDLAPGEVVSVRIEASLDPSLTGGQAQSTHARFNVLAGLADPSAPAAAAGCPTIAGVIPSLPNAGGTIASTGAQAPAGALMVAGMALGCGWLMILAARRRRRESETTR